MINKRNSQIRYMIMSLVVYVLSLLLKLLRIDTYFLISIFYVNDLLSNMTTKNMNISIQRSIFIYKTELYFTLRKIHLCVLSKYVKVK
jgi:hypothetical protein